jgi:hypothetical protein
MNLMFSCVCAFLSMNLMFSSVCAFLSMNLMFNSVSAFRSMTLMFNSVSAFLSMHDDKMVNIDYLWFRFACVHHHELCRIRLNCLFLNLPAAVGLSIVSLDSQDLFIPVVDIPVSALVFSWVIIPTLN